MTSSLKSAFPLPEVFAGKAFAVPDYQRGYAWEARQLQEFIDDLECLPPGKSHYTGTLVLHETPETVRNAARDKFVVHNVVDGQQRLTTIAILLSVVQKEFAGLKETATADRIRDTYLAGTLPNGQSFHRLVLNADCRTYFAQAIIDGVTWSSGPAIESQRRLEAAKEFFESYLTDRRGEAGFTAWLEEFHDKLTISLKFGIYFVEQDAEVGIIFEVMNNRGKQLSELEKVKNYLLYVATKLSVDASQLFREINDTWSEVFRNLMRCHLVDSSDEDRLIRAHWLMAYDHQAQKWAGSKSIKDRFKLKSYAGRHAVLLSDLLGYTRSLRQSVAPFCDAHRPDAASFSGYSGSLRDDIRYSSTKLRRTNVLAPFLPLLIGFRLKATAKEYLTLVQLLEKFAFRVYRWAQKRSNTGQAALYSLGFEFFAGSKSTAAALQKVRHTALRYFANTTFRNDFAPAADNPFYGWAGLKYFLYEYEEYLAKGQHIQLTWEQLEKTDAKKSIEHILPQTPKKGQWTRFNAADRAIYTHALGNLCLTADNSHYGRKEFTDKRGDRKSTGACYTLGKLFMERDLAKHDNWTPAKVSTRNDEIRDWAVIRWHLDDGDLPAQFAPEDEEKEAAEPAVELPLM